MLPEYFMGRDEDDLVLKNYQGKLYRYPDPVDQCMGDTPAPTPWLDQTGETGMLIGLTYDLETTTSMPVSAKRIQRNLTVKR